MEPALHLALDGGATHDRIRQVVFLTDGAVGNEAHLLALITKGLGDSRLFTVGIGSAPNSYFMTRAATMGRGTYTYIGKVTEVKEKMADLFAKLENPVISDIQLRSVNGETEAMEICPSPIPDLYQGEPLVVALRTHGHENTLHVSGKLQGKP